MYLSQYIEYTLLKPTTTEREIIDLCYEAIEHNYHVICINSSFVPLAAQFLKDSNTKVCSVIGFPFGAMSTQAKVFEAKKAIEDGAQEIEMVINLGFLRSKNYVSVFKDISDVKSAIGDTTLKVVLEISELNKNEIVKACEICVDANVDYIKTSSGFSKGGATLTATKIIKKTIKDAVKIDACGDIVDLETGMKYLEAGVHRIGFDAILSKKTKKAKTISYKTTA
ncbi:deoxyribose-phosphate aldolase [Aestuariibaculum sediminum]|uniref:Deoxyribose-phosphate aldolase n=1 Tax=Aestuariibaculum sediminum TaxID=2770637 RepID=A0A8J6Q2X4_9FLAO|nr:deoxyribose-phosphate aldolase [Aestuariibaculum sediminum]MBD0832759.1 deoxyribose-phosphate aldolase [Aestuariibaculum sediminum]